MRDRLLHVSSALLLTALLGVALATFRDYGITADEGVQNRYGRRIVRWYATLGADAGAVEQNDLYLYGGFFEVVVQAAEPVSGLGVYDNRHLVNALFGLVGFVAVWGLGCRVGGAATGFLSVLFLALTPGYYGHLFANPKDLPFASLYALAAWVVLRARDRLPRPGWREVLGVGVAVGLAAGVRVAGLALFGYAAALWAGSLWLGEGGGAGRGLSARARDTARVGVAGLGALAVGWTVMVASWPWAQLDPIGNPLRALQRFSRFWNPDLLYDGRLVAAEAVPRSYLPKMLALTLPELYLVALLLGAAAVAAWLLRLSRQPPERESVLRVLWVAALAVAPVAWVVVRRTPLYNGYRHVLFVIPFLAVLAAAGVAAFLRLRARPPLRAAALLALVASLALAAADSVRLHPYQYVFFNRILAGGLPRAVERYDTDYWGASYKEGIEWMVRRYPPARAGGRVRVAGHSGQIPFFYYLDRTEEGRRSFLPVRIQDRPHLVFASTSYQERRRTPGRVVHVVERLGAPLLYLVEAKAPELPTR